MDRAISLAMRLPAHLVSALSLTLVSLSLSACGLPGAPNVPAVVLEHCFAKNAAPVTTDEVVAALKEHGFSVEVMGCMGGALDVHAEVANWSPTEGSLNEDEGDLRCAIRSHPLWGEEARVYVEKGDLLVNGRTRGEVLNVDCQMDIDGEPNQEHIVRLRGALTQLARDHLGNQPETAR